MSALLSPAARKLRRPFVEGTGISAKLEFQWRRRCSGVKRMSTYRPNLVTNEMHTNSHTVAGSHPSQRTRFNADGGNPTQEWQCEECRNWYTSLEWRVVNLKQTGTGADWCRYCRPPKAGGTIDHLWSGGAVLLSWPQPNDFTRAMKRAIDRQKTD